MDEASFIRAAPFWTILRVREFFYVYSGLEFGAVILWQTALTGKTSLADLAPKNRLTIQRHRCAALFPQRSKDF